MNAVDWVERGGVRGAGVTLDGWNRVRDGRMGGKKESEGEGAGLYGLRSTTKEKSGAPKLYSVEEENVSR